MLQPSADNPLYRQSAEMEECYNLAPVIKNLRNNADLLNAFFIDTEGNKN